MHDAELILSLARLLIAVAWVDGQITFEETNSLKDLLFRLPHINGETWKRLDMYIESPVDEQERMRLIAGLKSQIRTMHDKELVCSALAALTEADGQRTDKEVAVLDEIRQAVDTVDTGLFGRLAQLFRPRIQQRCQIAETREARFEDVLRNQVFYRLKQRTNLSDLDLEDHEQRKLCLAGTLLARVAHVDEDIHEKERDRIEQIIMKRWGLGPDQAAMVAEISLSEIRGDIDHYRTARRFFELTTGEERLRLVVACFAVAAADGHTSHEENEEIRDIANSLRLSHRQFIDAKAAVLR